MISIARNIEGALPEFKKIEIPEMEGHSKSHSECYGYMLGNSDPVFMVNMAVGGGEVELEIRKNEERNLSEVIFSTSPRDEISILAKQMSLDRYISDTNCQPPKFLRVDVEGYECMVFRGANRLIRDHFPILMFEALDDEHTKTSVQTLRHFSGGNYEFVRIDHECNLWRPDE